MNHCHDLCQFFCSKLLVGRWTLVKRKVFRLKSLGKREPVSQPCHPRRPWKEKEKLWSLALAKRTKKQWKSRKLLWKPKISKSLVSCPWLRRLPKLLKELTQLKRQPTIWKTCCPNRNIPEFGANTTFTTAKEAAKRFWESKQKWKGNFGSLAHGEINCAKVPPLQSVCGSQQLLATKGEVAFWSQDERALWWRWILAPCPEWKS